MATSLVTPLLLPTTPSRVPSRTYETTARRSKVAIVLARRVELEAKTGLVPLAAGPLSPKDHAVAHPDEVEEPVGLV